MASLFWPLRAARGGFIWVRPRHPSPVAAADFPSGVAGLVEAGVRPFLTLIALRNLGSASLLTLLPILWHTHGGRLAGAGALVAVVYVFGMVGNLAGAATPTDGGAAAARGLVGVGHLIALPWAVGLDQGWLFWATTAAWGFAANGGGAAVGPRSKSDPGVPAWRWTDDHGPGQYRQAFGAWAVAFWWVHSTNLKAGLLAAACCFVVALVPTTALTDPPSVTSHSVSSP